MSGSSLSFSLRTALGQFELNIEATFDRPVTGIFGVSGAGKTTLFKCLAGLRREVEGTITFNDTCWLDSRNNLFLAPEHRRIGYVPQNGLLFPNKNVKENLLIASHRRTQRSGAGQHGFVSLEAVCELLAVGDLLDRQVTRLSGGERQRVALGRALCSDPDILLLDEPLAALDFQLKRQILPYLYRIREEVNIPMIMISHQPSEIQALCDEVLVVGEGRKVAFGDAQKILLDQTVLKLTNGEHYENIVPATVLAQPVKNDQARSNSLLAIGEGFPVNLLTEKVNLKAGNRLMVGIPANDIIVATVKPEGLSAQNILAAQVTTLEVIEDKCLVHASINSASLELHAEVSTDSIKQLGIKAGDSVFLVIKSSGCIIYQ